MKMETLSRDSLYLKQRLNLNIDVEFVRQGGKEGHTTADRWKVDSGKSTYKQEYNVLSTCKITFQKTLSFSFKGSRGVQGSRSEAYPTTCGHI